MAAATATSKPQAPPISTIKTPLSATYPSELRSPLPGSPAFIKREEGALKTPITPPNAYVDFLKAFSPSILTPLPTGSSSKFTFGDKTPAPSSATISEKSSPLPSASQPPSSATSACSCAATAGEGTKAARPSPKITIPPSPFTRPMSARTASPRGYNGCPSPFSPSSARSPLSAHSVQSPFSATLSPRERDEAGKPGRQRAVSVRQVVTRTVTYTRTPVTPLEPAPRGKRRKVEE
ncbi:hypothetical protein BDY21DRAFT_364248 [Lineolata rhizophorae]|uniref:Uncharacterized protein n=1 Tax=Lineolata rhizophorae TaxID=578093 RepID=A0A6A6NZI7_9PEZI|nr:hypothetical protein BDY21DRAFT_364248 [Lineolata rhizophorae]